MSLCLSVAWYYHKCQKCQQLQGLPSCAWLGLDSGTEDVAGIGVGADTGAAASSASDLGLEVGTEGVASSASVLLPAEEA